MKIKSCLVVLAVLWSVSGCASVIQSSDDEGAELRQRVNQRWQYLLAGKLDEAYALLSPGSRALMPLAAYKGSLKSGLWRDAKLIDFACESNTCKVEVGVSYEYVRPNVKYESVRSLHETWVKEGGQWWYVQLR